MGQKQKTEREKKERERKEERLNDGDSNGQATHGVHLIRDTFNHILGSAIDDQQWAQAQLPVAMGGLGMRGAVEHSPGAFISSVFAAEGLKEGLLLHGNTTIDLSSAQALLSQNLQEDIPREELPELSQKMLSYKVDTQLQLSLVNSLTDQRDKARLASLGLAHSGDWLNVVPSPILFLAFT